jgi:hypothetical protein
MTKQKYYRYLGVNGYIETPIELPGVYNTSYYRLIADEGKALTDGEKLVEEATVLEKDLDNWTEVDK